MMRRLAITAGLGHAAALGAVAFVAAGVAPGAAIAQPVEAENIVEATTVVRDTAETPGDQASSAEQGSTDAAAPAGGFEIPSGEALTRLETQLEFVDLFEEQRYADALPLAEALIPLAEAEFGRPSEELATAINNLAVVQRYLMQYEESKETYLTAIDMYRTVEGPYTESIIVPLVSLGANYHATGDYTQALGIFQEARTVNRRAFGLLNPDQVEIVYHIASTLGSMSRFEEAHYQHEDALRLMERVHGSATMEILPYIYRYAEWLAASFQFDAGRFQLVRAIDIIREIEGPDSIALVQPLRAIGNSYRRQKLAEGRGVGSLKRALEIAQTSVDADPLTTARVLRDIGDWYTAFSRVRFAGDEYRQAWHLLGRVEDGEAIRARWFSEPNYVLREYPSSRGLAEAEDFGAIEGFVRVTFDVDQFGGPQNVTVLESEPPGFKDGTMTSAIRRSRFRPRVVDGELVYSTGLIRNFTFHYEPEE